MNEEHDPWNEPAHRHPRAQEIMARALWSCVNEDAPFGSDEGATAYDEYRRWRAENPGAPLLACIEWIGAEDDYPDAYTFDATLIATVLGQLVDEGRIEQDAKPVALAAIERQLEDAEEERTELLDLARRAIVAG